MRPFLTSVNIIVAREQEVKGDGGGGRRGIQGGLQRKWPQPDPPEEKTSSTRHVFETADERVITQWQ